MLPVEMQLVCDADHLWSCTHENFWQDTVRKGVAPPTYLSNLAGEVETYLVTEPGKEQARRLLADRAGEVWAWTSARTVLEAEPDATTG